MIDLPKISHGHVVKNKTGTLARCGGPVICSHCQLEAELTDLRDTVGKLPKTADGVVVTPGMEIWYWMDSTSPILCCCKLHTHHTESTLTEMDGWKKFQDCYSTEAAARAAERKQP